MTVYNVDPVALSAPDGMIASIRSRGILVAEISDADLTIVLNDLLFEYARHRPVYASLTFDTVAGQASYSWDDVGDEDGISIVKCLWNGLGASFAGLPYSDWQSILTTFGVADWDMPSLELIERIKLMEANRYSAGSAYQHSPAGTIYLTPAPTQAGMTVYLLYTKGYATLDDIPEADYDIFLDLVESKLAARAVRVVAASGMAANIKTPQYEHNLGTEIGFYRAVQKEKYESFLQKCNAGQVAAARS